MRKREWKLRNDRRDGHRAVHSLWCHNTRLQARKPSGPVYRRGNQTKDPGLGGWLFCPFTVLLHSAKHTQKVGKSPTGSASRAGKANGDASHHPLHHRHRKQAY